MAQSISIAGASYPDVPSIECPKTGGGTAVFYDASVATATASEVLSGYTAFGANGLMTGTAPGGTPPTYSAFAYHMSTSSSYVKVGEGTVFATHGSDPACFEYSSGEFTCKKAGAYTVKCFGRGGNTTGGGMRYCHFQFYINNTVVASKTDSTVSNSGYNNTYSATLSVDDVVYIQTKSSSNGVTHDFGYIIEPLNWGS